MYARYPPIKSTCAAVIGIISVAISFIWERRQGFSLADEGYLWYGIQRVLSGEVPIRDFQAYDPGRYYWSAFLMWLSGTNGIVAVRDTLAILQGFSLAVVLWWLAITDTRQKSVGVGVGFIIIAALVLVAWMGPRHKLYDISISIGLICVLANLVRCSSRINYFSAGLFTGLAAYFGRNHGVYGAVAACGVFFYLSIGCIDWRSWRQGIALYVVGIIVGYLPMLATMLLAHGFTTAFIGSIEFIFKVKETNLPLPVPWPWLASFGTAPPAEALRALLLGLFFVAIAFFACLSICYVLWARKKGRAIPPLLVACAFCAVPYLHYAYSRADMSHLAQGVFPALIGTLALIVSVPSKPRVLAAGALCIASWFTTAQMHPGLQCLERGACVRVTVGNDALRMDQSTARNVELLRQLANQFAPVGQSFFVAPFMPGAYALFRARSPTWEIYTAWPRSDAFQREEIARIAASKPGFILIDDDSLDGRDALRYRNTHPLIYQYIQTNCERVRNFSDETVYHIYRPR
ncbi:hypothetical protein EAH75_09620 [Rhodanobacter glycinis]|nr:hypothetical protein EAH75_09620 [Rhodanobacter glycinis]